MKGSRSSTGAAEGEHPGSRTARQALDVPACCGVNQVQNAALFANDAHRDRHVLSLVDFLGASPSTSKPLWYIPRLRTRVMSYSGEVEVRSLEDALGATCARYATEVCSDCGTALCSEHKECCELCNETFCSGCLSLHKAQAGHAKVRLGGTSPSGVLLRADTAMWLVGGPAVPPSATVR